jgi:hypothetical protein
VINRDSNPALHNSGEYYVTSARLGVSVTFLMARSFRRGGRCRADCLTFPLTTRLSLLLLESPDVLLAFIPHCW